MTRKELITSPEYQIANIECDLYYLYETHPKIINFSQKEIDNLKIQKLVEVAISCGKIPIITYVNIEDYVNDDLLK